MLLVSNVLLLKSKLLSSSLQVASPHGANENNWRLERWIATSLPRVRGSPKKRSTNPLNELGTSKLIKKNIIVHHRS